MTDARELYKIFKGQRPLDLSQEDLKDFSSERKKDAIFVPAALEETYRKLPKEKKERLKAYGEAYYPRVINDIENVIPDKAHELLLIVRSGLSPSDLDEDELLILRNRYGQNWFEKVGLEHE